MPQSTSRDNSLQSLEMQRISLEDTVQQLRLRVEEEERKSLATLRKYKQLVPHLAKYKWANFETEKAEDPNE